MEDGAIVLQSGASAKEIIRLQVNQCICISVDAHTVHCSIQWACDGLSLQNLQVHCISSSPGVGISRHLTIRFDANSEGYDVIMQRYN